MPPTPLHLDPASTNQFTARLEQTTTAEVRFTPGDRALYASDLSHYRQVPARRCRPAHPERRHRHRCRLSRVWAAPLRPWRRHFALGPDLQRGRGARLLEVPQRNRRVQPATALRLGAARPDQRRPPPRRRTAQPHLRARPRHARLLHPRRHDRQQLLRSPLRARRQNQRQHRRA